ncbi:hypothetical protein [Glutamicibacter sp. ZJUTW]|uniref:hypothetical protein n=1 Tax=Glutamicibacter sp. ZJUTW TaxID=1155384 RepID=UPI0011F19BE2|nr:hypothetical protein [Glutamicibacter sp. ZJUTW]QEP08727.1 hypothetical protein F0M17_16580 [Glutamicibacter sp. ZJUTW]
MDWTTIIVQGLITITALGTAWLTLRSKIAELGKTASEAAHKAEEAATASHKTEQSINNRDSPASDRWDEIHDDVKSVKETLAEQGRDIRGLQDTAHLTRQSIGRLSADDRLGRRETELLRKDFGEHLEQAAERDRLIRELHKQYVDPPAEHE